MIKAIRNAILLIPLVVLDVLVGKQQSSFLKDDLLPLAAWLWLLATLFLGIMLAVHIPSVTVEPARSIVSLIIATGMSGVVMWFSGFVVQNARDRPQRQNGGSSVRTILPPKPFRIRLARFLGVAPRELESTEPPAESSMKFWTSVATFIRHGPKPPELIRFFLERIRRAVRGQ